MALLSCSSSWSVQEALSGPFQIIKCLSDVTYRIADVQAKRHRQVVHFDRLKLCPPDIRLPSDQQPSQPPTVLPPLKGVM